MGFTVSNQRPSTLSAYHPCSATGDYDPGAAMQATIIDPIYTPVRASAPVSVVDANGNDVDQDSMLHLLGATLDEDAGVDLQAEADLGELLGKTLQHYDPDKDLLVNQLFVNQTLTSHQLPMPDPVTAQYAPKVDIVPQCKEILLGNDHADELFAAIAVMYKPNTLGFWFATEVDFEDFKLWLKQGVAGHSLDVVARDLMNDLDAWKLDDLAKGLVLRENDLDNTDELCFARILVSGLVNYREHLEQVNPATAATTFGIMPFALNELFNPRAVVLVNIEQHARATTSRINNCWTSINRQLVNQPKILNPRQITALDTADTAAKKLAGMTATTATAKNKQATRMVSVKFRRTPPNSVDKLAMINRVMKHLGRVNKSLNPLKIEHRSFRKASRNRPDDPNIKGIVTRNDYLPDIHIYLDCSGSISEENYRAEVIDLIRFAKKKNIDLYFTSFSHVMSSTTKLRIKDRSVGQIWKAFQAIPKVSGFTDYVQIWNYVNASKRRRQEFSLVITDFEWAPDSAQYEHPRRLYYMPVAGLQWDYMVDCAKTFAQRMRHIEPNIAARMLGVIA